MPDQKTMRTTCLGGFSVMWVIKLLISPVKTRIFCPKTTKFGPKLAFLVNLGQAMQAYLVPCWWVVWWLWRAGCISQDTYLLYCYNIFSLKNPHCWHPPHPVLLESRCSHQRQKMLKLVAKCRSWSPYGDR